MKWSGNVLELLESSRHDGLGWHYQVGLFFYGEAALQPVSFLDLHKNKFFAPQFEYM